MKTEKLEKQRWICSIVMVGIFMLSSIITVARYLGMNEDLFSVLRFFGIIGVIFAYVLGIKTMPKKESSKQIKKETAFAISFALLYPVIIIPFLLTAFLGGAKWGGILSSILLISGQLVLVIDYFLRLRQACHLEREKA